MVESFISRESPNDSAISLSLDHHHLCLSFISVHVVRLDGITLLRRTIHRSADCFFSSPFDPLPSGLTCCNRRQNFDIRSVAKFAWRCTFCIFNSFLPFCFRYAHKCPCSYQILKYLKHRSFYHISR